MQLAYLGPAGTFSEEAARAYQSRSASNGLYELIPMRSIADLLLAVNRGEYALGIVPVENSIEGPIALTLDMLVHEVDLQIVAEEVVPIRHCLLTREGVTLDQITTVLSHPQALAQCRQNLSRLLPDADIRTANSTADAARLVANSSEPWAAIGTSLAGELYGLGTPLDAMQDSPENATRFLVVGKEEPGRTGHDKTSLVFAFRADKPGNLYAALHEFAEREINLTKLESRPAKRSLGDYIFFVDMEGHQDDADVMEALAAIEQMSAFFRILGSYPRTEYSHRHM